MRTPLALAAVLLAAAAAHAHYNMLLPNVASAKKGDEVVFTYQWGHPFEHELFDAPAPESMAVRGPDGKSTDLSKALEKVALPAGDQKKLVAWQFRFTPADRGDYAFLLKTQPIWMDEDGGYYLQDEVKVVLHVQEQKGWDAAAGREFELTPLTRPYGLEPGVAFQAALQAGRPNARFDIPPQPVAGALVEVERYNETPPKEADLPPDEHRTRVAKTDPNGVVTATLTDPGWWCLCAARDNGTKDHDSKPARLKQRAILWVAVDRKGGK
jgi:cobalt/nickel transport protein